MKQFHSILYFSLVILCATWAQTPAPNTSGAQAPQAGRGGIGGPAPPSAPPFKKTILVMAAAKGYEHDSISDAMGTIWKMGRDSGMWEAYLRTDYELITKKNIGRNAKNLTRFDALVFANSTGEMALDDDQKQDLLSFVHDDGKGFVGIHAAMDSNYMWPEYAEMIGG